MTNYWPSLKSSLLVLLVFSSEGCDYFKKERYDKLTEDLQSLTNQVTSIASDPGKTADEIKKLRVYEYTTFDVADSDSPGELDRALNKMGKEFWDCFHVERRPLLRRETLGTSTDASSGVNIDRGQINFEYRIFCKRQPFTPLRYLVR